MDKLKTRLLFISLIMLALVSVSAVAAADVDDVVIDAQDDFDLSEETTDVEQLSANDQEDDSQAPLTAGDPDSFSDLQGLVDATPDDGELVLSSDYAILSDDDKPIIVNRSITIDGQGHTLDAKNLNVTMSCLKPVTLKNIVFTNSYGTGDYIVEYGYNIYLYGALNFNSDEEAGISCEGSVVDNCTFINNEAYDGAAIYTFSDNVTIKNSRFEGNKADKTGTGVIAGGAIIIKGDNCQVLDSNFTENTARDSGGAIFWEGDNGKIDGCNFTSNEAQSGGAVEYYLCNHQNITNSYFSKNKATASGGGAVRTATDGLDDIKIDTCTFEDNFASTNGGAIEIISIGPIEIKNSNFYNNTADDEGNGHGGAIYVDTANVDFDNLVFINNTAYEGGAFYVDYQNAQSDNVNLTVSNSKFIENTATNNGGAVSSISPDLTFDTCNFEKNVAGSYGSGGAIAVMYALAKINVTGSTFTENSASFYGGSIICYGTNSLIDDCIFVNNTINYYGGAVYTDIGNNIVINNSKFYENKAEIAGRSVAGAAYINGPNNILEHCEFNGNTAKYIAGAVYLSGSADKVEDCVFSENTAPYAGAMWVASPKGIVKDSEFTENNATIRAGALYVSGPGVLVDNGVFTRNTAPDGGAIYTQGNDIFINKGTFEENNATNAGAIYAGGAQGNTNNLNINDTKFINNNATQYGGALVVNIGGTTDIDNSNFNMNKAFSGSAIYHNIGSLVVSNTELLENLANSTSLTLEVADIENHFDVIFKTDFQGYDNLLNGIYTKNNDVTLTNVKYHGFEEEMNTGADAVNPVASADDSEEGALVYKDAREAGINITVSIYDENDNFICNITEMTDIYGNNSASKLALIPGKYKAYAIHDEDAYYTYIKSEAIEFEIEEVQAFVTVDRVVNYTGAVVTVIANVTDADGNSIDGGTATYIIQYDNKLSSGLLMASAVSYTAEVIDGQAVFKDITLGAPGTYPSTIEYSGNDYYTSAENKSEVDVLPLNTTTESDDVTGSSGDKVDIVADIVDQNGDPVKNGTAVLKVNGKEYTAEVVDGKATFKNVELPDESTDATIEYLGNDYYNPSNTTIKITIIPDEPIPDNNTTEPVTPIAEKAVPVIPAAGNPIALAVLALLALVSTVSLGKK